MVVGHYKVWMWEKLIPKLQETAKIYMKMNKIWYGDFIIICEKFENLHSALLHRQSLLQILWPAL